MTGRILREELISHCPLDSFVLASTLLQSRWALVAVDVQCSKDGGSADMELVCDPSFVEALRAMTESAVCPGGRG